MAAIAAEAAGLAAGALHAGWTFDWRAFLRRAAELEWDHGRAVLWLAPAFSIGILAYGLAGNTPTPLAGPLLALVLLALAFRLRAHFGAFALTCGLAAIACGFAAATLEERRHADAPRLFWPVRAEVSGVVERVEPRQRDLRATIRVTRFTGLGAQSRPELVRVSLSRRSPALPGDLIRLTATWLPPAGPMRPGGYDAAWLAHLQGIGAFGRAASDIQLRPPRALSISDRIERYRLDLARRIDSAAGGPPSGPIAAALVTGVRGAIPAEAENDLRVAGLSHLLSISGTHLALVAGVLFFAVRALLALSKTLALERPIKSWAALVALAGITFYLVLSGAEVATQRSYLMSAIVLIAVAVGRPALTLRNVALAALVVLAISPASLFGPSLQMSFAAVLAIVAGFRWMTAPDPGGERRLLPDASRWFWRFFVAALLTTLLAGLATAPFAAYHFHRLAPYSLLGNLLALPLVSFWIMPAAVLGAMLLPFGLDGFAWALMGAGIDCMLGIAKFVAHLPGAERFFPAFGGGALLLIGIALLLATLCVSALRYLSVPVLALAVLLVARTEQPDVLVEPTGRAVAVRDAEGRLRLLGTRHTSLAGRSWLEGDGIDPAQAPSAAIPCRGDWCETKLADGGRVVLVRELEGLEAACATQPAILVTRFRAPEDCRAGSIVLDRDLLAITGALTLWQATSGEGGFRYVAARPPGDDRAWFGRGKRAEAEAALLPTVLRAGATRPAAQPDGFDATAEEEDRDEGAW